MLDKLETIVVVVINVPVILRGVVALIDYIVNRKNLGHYEKQRLIILTVAAGFAGAYLLFKATWLFVAMIATIALMSIVGGE